MFHLCVYSDAQGGISDAVTSEEDACTPIPFQLNLSFWNWCTWFPWSTRIDSSEKLCNLI
jgi:hypothetical protein